MMAFKQMECVNQMKKEFLIVVKRCPVIAMAGKGHPLENVTFTVTDRRVATSCKSKSNINLSVNETSSQASELR